MRRMLVILTLALALPACKPQHPVNVTMTDDFKDTEKALPKIAVLDCTSSLARSDDPDNLAPKTMGRYLVPALQGRSDYRMIAPTTVSYAVDKAGTQEKYAKFLKSYAMSDKPDMTFLTPLAADLQCDAFLIPVVDLWQKDEVDITENATPVTYVGATITIVSATDGSIMFRCTDEDYIEGASSETGDRSVVTGGSGAIYADLGKKVHRAPPFEDVAAKVAAALVSGLPAR